MNVDRVSFAAGNRALQNGRAGSTILNHASRAKVSTPCDEPALALDASNDALRQALEEVGTASGAKLRY